MNHHQLSALKGGERIKVWQNGEYAKATFMGHIRGADPAAWIAFDDNQINGRGMTGTKVYTGLQFKEGYWNECNKDIPEFLLLTEEELTQEVIEKMEVVG